MTYYVHIWFNPDIRINNNDQFKKKSYFISGYKFTKDLIEDEGNFVEVKFGPFIPNSLNIFYNPSKGCKDMYFVLTIKKKKHSGQ